MKNYRFSWIGGLFGLRFIHTGVEDPWTAADGLLMTSRFDYNDSWSVLHSSRINNAPPMISQTEYDFDCSHRQSHSPCVLRLDLASILHRPRIKGLID